MSNLNKKQSVKEIIGRKVISGLTFISPTLSSKALYRIHIKKKLNLKNPKSFNEKLMYLKLHDYKNNPLIVKCSDKIMVREYVKECGFETLLNKIYGIYDDANEIDFNKLPNKFVLKCNHGCGFNIICIDKDNFDTEKAKKTLNKWKNTKFGYDTCETHYFKIKPKIFAEEYIATDDGIMPNDYKIYCFNGKAKVILVCSERDKELKFSYFDTKWQKLDYGRNKYKTKKNIKKPKNIDKMIRYAEKLSKPFKFVRVDFYDNGEKLIFGELTFTPARCCDTDYNPKATVELGNMLDIN